MTKSSANDAHLDKVTCLPPIDTDGGPVVKLLVESELVHETDHIPLLAQPGAGLAQHDVGGQNLLHLFASASVATSHLDNQITSARVHYTWSFNVISIISSGT